MSREVAQSSEELLVVVGPTASGKTAFAVRLAERIGGEVVSADSVQVYRRFDIGTGKATAEERQRVPHHLIDILDPLDPIDAARWATLADEAIADIRRRGARPIVCGGTFLWVQALLRGLAPAPPADPVLRERHRVLAEEHGRSALHSRLAEVDALSAARLSPNDFVRVSRALEVYELTGTTLSAWHEAHGFKMERYRARLLGIRWDPGALTEKIRARVSAMLDAGLVDEVRSLLSDGFGEARAFGSVGYRQVVSALARGPIERDALADEIVRATRIFARRQRTWLREQPVTWLDPETAPSFVPWRRD